jgi:glycosyltransferase involved in cell wall biosynthesis
MGPPRTSVLMPAFNAEETLRESVESVLAQRLGDLELIVIDDASETPVTEVLAGIHDERMRIVRRRRNGGIGRARNSGLAVARAPCASQLDADDLWDPDYLESVLPSLEKPGIGLVYTNATIIGHPDGHTDYIGDASIHPRDRFPELAEANPAPCPTVTVRADAIRSVGGYSGWIRGVEDWHLYMRLAAAGWRFAYLDRALAAYRWPARERGLSYDSSRMERGSRLALADIAVRHPLIPGPKRQLWRRLRRGFDHGAR